MKKFFSLFAAVLFAASMMADEVTVSKSIHDLFPDDANGTQEATLYSDDAISISVNADGNNGKVYGTGTEWRLYQTNNAVVTVAATDATIKTVAFEFSVKNTGVLNFGGAAMTSNTAVNVNATSAQFVVANSGTATNGQVIIKSFIVVYETGEVPPTPSVNYYVAGSMNNWGPADAYMLTPSNNGEYKGEFTFAANDELKVIGFDGETTTWFPEGMGNNFVIAEDGDYQITFNPAGNVDGWYAGFFNVVKKEEPVIPQYEVAEAIAAGLTDDTEIEVRGVVTKMQIKGKNFANYGSACIYVKDATGAEGEFEFYNCYSFEGAKFTSTIPAYDATSTAWADLTKLADANGNEIRLGDTIVAFGKYKLFNSTYELNTGCYIVDIKPASVAPAQDINVNMSEGLFYDDHVADAGWWQLYGEDEHFVISVSNVETTQAEGTYTIADLDADWTYLGIIDGTDTTYVSFVDGSVNLSISAEGDVTVAGTLVGDDGNNYILNLVFVSPKPTVTVDVNIQNAELIDYYADYGLYGVYGTDANDIYVQFAIWTETFEGEFTEKDLDFQYIGSGIFEGEEQVNIYTAAITVTPGNGGDYNITATVIGYNNKQYNVTMYVPAGETAIENVDAAVKAIKRLVNGNLLIEKGNKTYNANGARIR